MKHEQTIKRPSKAAQGFTLVEVLLAVSLSAMIMLALGAMLDVTLNTDTFNRQTGSVSQIGRLIGERMSYDIRHANDTAVLTNGIRITPNIGGPFTQIEYQLTNNGDLEYRTQGGPGGSQTYTLLGVNDQVICTAFNVSITEQDVTDTGTFVTTLATVRITLQNGDVTHTVVASGSPRVNLK